MKDEIELHPEKGVNPHLVMCARCGKDTGEIALLGVANGKYTCKSCGTIHFGYKGSPRDGCQHCGGHEFKRTEMYDTDKLPGICDECAKRQKECDEEVRNGGVYFRCEKCGSEGAIKADRPLAALVREKSGIKAPGAVGIDLDDCPNCWEEGGDGKAGQAEGESDPGVHDGGAPQGGPEADGCGCGACGRPGRAGAPPDHEDGG